MSAESSYLVSPHSVTISHLRSLVRQQKIPWSCLRCEGCGSMSQQIIDLGQNCQKFSECGIDLCTGFHESSATSSTTVSLSRPTCLASIASTDPVSKPPSVIIESKWVRNAAGLPNDISQVRHHPSLESSEESTSLRESRMSLLTESRMSPLNKLV